MENFYVIAGEGGFTHGGDVGFHRACSVDMLIEAGRQMSISLTNIAG